MKLAQYYSHLNGYEFLAVHQSSLWSEIVEIIEAVDAEQVKTKISKEKTKMGTALYSPKGLNRLYKAEFDKRRWRERRIQYFVTDDLAMTKEIVSLKEPGDQKEAIEKNHLTPYRTYNQVDFVKERAAVEVQFGKYFSVQYDLHVKHTFFYSRDDIDVGIEIIPTHKLMSCMSSGVPWYENELTNIVREGRSNPSVPLVLIGVEP